MHRQPESVIEIRDPSCGLCAFLVIDDRTLGPAAGGIRTKAYESEAAALEDARVLARAMTFKCALAHLKAGGGKCVVMDHDGLDRPRAFAVLGREVEELGGRFRTAGDLGTSSADLKVMANHTRYVHPEQGLADAVGQGLLACLKTVAFLEDWDIADLDRFLAGRHAVVQGAGTIGTAVARALAGAGARITLSDLDPSRAGDRAAEIGADVVPAEDALRIPCDVLAPCATGGVITLEVAANLSTRVLCGAANNILAEPLVAERLKARGIIHVPDIIASAGAVIDGIGRSVMRLESTRELIEGLGITALQVLNYARMTGRTSEAAALMWAESRIDRAWRALIPLRRGTA